ncbi:28S ribosomal protein S23, mitochondrial [Nasonia vitripennis]|uniref:Small ribosomal subunit protein mS23 n=1 Tax=Nasonia vitripennis TaxID=7425 RepID=A0A7M7G8K9_NASVI|nr:28S ribosomal protein S23, mitochondrial [Nasonia vitripennis]XP_003425757.1 28S ribosomal protein S23, mitochondrial [Nasonia vitripennis]XP_008203965.1 28S ribosomal protein S23, mitochondrial [Nasonia vitripennis]
MAQSRLEKVGTIYSRLTSLIKSGGIPEENKPIWLDLYKAFPPKYEPTFSRPASGPPVRKIFYTEDLIRAQFHKHHRRYSNVNLLDNKSVSRTESFILIYRQLEKDGVPQDEIYNKAIEEFLEKFKHEQALKEAEKADTAAESSQRPLQGLSIKRLVADKESKFGKKLAKKASEESKELTEEEKKMYKPIRFSLEKIMEDKETTQEVKKPE